MRDSISCLDLDAYLSQVVEKVPTERIITLATNVIVDPNFQNLTFFDVGTRQLDEKILLSILSWYLPVEVGFVLREDLFQSLFRLSLEDRSVIELLIESKAVMLLFLEQTSLWHNRDFFGNIVSQKAVERVLRILSPSSFHRKIRKSQRKRGYDDKGSKVDPHKWMPKFDFDLTELQNQIEDDRKVARETLLFTKGVLE